MMKLQQIASENETAKAVFSTWAQRRRFRRETNLPRFEASLLQDGHKIVRQDFLQLFKRLEDAGIGSIIVGRHGKPNRFVWNYNLKDVAKNATIETASPQEFEKASTVAPKSVIIRRATLGSATRALLSEKIENILTQLGEMVDILNKQTEEKKNVTKNADKQSVD